MKHIGRVTEVRWDRMKEAAGYEPDFADAKTDFQNALWRAWSDYVYQKKNEVAIQ
ncbi:MAG TPA: hypothetical protein PLO37_05205 [Candidatus Hydrogenedentes bacterium]|nr:hypothetical protein [Candidatus Hydrogenedentota bacterium]HPG66223.1 hypothetical protein [Candidatus Hydrogenedentota bacterium]